MGSSVRKQLDATRGRTHKCYGWLYYYAQITDASVLAHLDMVVDALLEHAGKTRTEDMRRI